MATVNKLRHFVEVSSIAADWAFKINVPGVVTFKAVKFFPGDAGDELVIKEGSATGPLTVRLKSSDGDGRLDREVSAISNPFIDYSECTFTAGAVVLFILDRPLL